MTTFPDSNLPADSQRWGREIQYRLDALEKTVQSNQINNIARDRQLQSNLDRTNTTTVVSDNDLTSAYQIVPYTGNDAARSGSTANVATVTINKPSWARVATVIATGSVQAYGDAATPMSGTMTISIAGVSPVFSVNQSGTTASKSISAESGFYDDAIMTFSRKFTVSGSFFSVSTIFNKPATLDGSSFIADINAIVYWSVR